MFGIGAPEITLVVVVIAVGLAYWSGTRSGWTEVDHRWVVVADGAALEQPMTTFLAALPATTLTAHGTLTWTVSVSRSQAWTIVPAVLLFPFGLLFLLFKEQADAQVLVRPAVGGGSEIRLVGRTRFSVQRAMDTAAQTLAPEGGRRVGV